MKDKSIVIIKPEAYYKMLVHVLRFGSKTREKSQYKEVMGMLMGYLEGEGEIKDVIIEDAVPVSHGGSIEVQFAPQDYITFAAIDEKFAEKNWFTVGWYHSHPNLKVFFSGTDIKNQMGWQTPNPSAIGIVFDHYYLETDPEFRRKYGLKPLNEGEIDYGFRTFRLDDPSKPSTNYHEVKSIVEFPDNIHYYLKIKKLIECIHANEPPILELNETPDIFGNVYIPFANQFMSDRPELETSSILTAFKDGVYNLLESSLEPLISFFNKFSQETVLKIVESNLKTRETLVSLKDILSKKMSLIQNNFKFSLSNLLDQLDLYFYDRFEGFDKDKEMIKESLETLRETISERVKQVIKDISETHYSSILSSLDNNITIISQSNENSKNSYDMIEKSKNQLSTLSQFFDSSLKSISQNASTIQVQSIDTIKNKINSLTSSLTSIKSLLGNISEVQNLFSTEIITKIHDLQARLTEHEDKNNLEQPGSPTTKTPLTEGSVLEPNTSELLEKLRRSEEKNNELERALNKEQDSYKKTREELKNLTIENQNLNNKLEKREEISSGPSKKEKKKKKNK
ncbi:MAG: Mov34/MPN/PAD-1 family protein [Candidatus Lokiarchaeota archaeon]|nr:Mov34/MPN/PAD-1 family protein [Candidatus Lokiarchaeota archaeon]